MAHYNGAGKNRMLTGIHGQRTDEKNVFVGKHAAKIKAEEISKQALWGIIAV